MTLKTKFLDGNVPVFVSLQPPANSSPFSYSVSFSVLRACEELVRTLGFDWLLMFMEEHLHSSTVTAALWILVVLLSNQSILNRFKEGLCGGGWLDHTDSVLTNKIGTVLGKEGRRAHPTLSPPAHLTHSVCSLAARHSHTRLQ